MVPSRQGRFDQKMVAHVAELAASQALFGALAVLDGARPIEDAIDKGSFELRYVKGGASTVLNDPAGDYLHDLFNERLRP